MGCGSNVVDDFFQVKQLPGSDEKGYFTDARRRTHRLTGGVTLNHLCWASALGVPTALVARQGDDDHGRHIRRDMAKHHVSTDFVRVSSNFTTSVSFVFVDETGERSIIMAPAATSTLTHSVMRAEYGKAVADAAIFTTEISQVPLSGVQYLLDVAREAGVPSMLDVDVPPSVATGAAALGTYDDVRRCLRNSDVVKMTAGAMEELFALVSPDKLSESLEEATAQMVKAFKCSMVCVTAGTKGSAYALADGTTAHAPILPMADQVDATGAGDAYMGGMVAAAYHWGMPTTKDGLLRMGHVASVAGAACTQTMGAIPSAKSVKLMGKLDADLTPWLRPPESEATPASSSSLGTEFINSVAADAHQLQALRKAAQASAELRHEAADMAMRINKAIKDGRMVYTTAVGKSAAVASRLAASLSSIGIPARFVHAVEWVHGDLGGLRAKDVVIALSNSGNTPEVVQLLPHLRRRKVEVLGMVGVPLTDLPPASVLSQSADLTMHVPTGNELLGVIPTRSIVAQEAACNGLLGELVALCGVTRGDFEYNHPGGAIGAQRK